MQTSCNYELWMEVLEKILYIIYTLIIFEPMYKFWVGDSSKPSEGFPFSLFLVVGPVVVVVVGPVVVVVQYRP